MGACEQSGRGCCGFARALVAGVAGPHVQSIGRWLCCQAPGMRCLRRHYSFSAEDTSSKACLHPRWERHRVHAALPLFLVKDFVNVEGEARTLQGEVSEAEACGGGSQGLPDLRDIRRGVEGRRLGTLYQKRAICNSGKMDAAETATPHVPRRLGLGCCVEPSFFGALSNGSGVPHPDGAICEDLPEAIFQLGSNLVRVGATEGQGLTETLSM